MTAILSGGIVGRLRMFNPAAGDPFFDSLDFTAHILLVFALTGIYSCQIKKTGGLGLAGYIVIMIANVMFVCVNAIAINC